MDKKQRKANQKLQQAQNFAENLRANQNLPLEEKALRTKVISPEIGKHLKFAILKENIYFDSYWALPTKRRNLPSLSGNTSPDSDATRLEIRIGVGRGDIGIDEDQVWVRYHFDLT